MASETVEIEVVGWEKYNPRSDRAGFSWFRMDNQFFLHMRQRKGYSADATLLMALLLAEASTNNGKSFKLRFAFAADMLGKTVKQIGSALEELLNCGDVRLKRLEAASTLTDGRTDETDETDETGQAAMPAVTETNLPHLANLWNQHRGKLPAVKGCKGKRLRAANARWEERPSTEHWTEIIERMAKSDFCLGKKNKPGPHENWKADFDFLVTPGTDDKVLEGKYDNGPPTDGGNGPVLPTYKPKEWETTDEEPMDPEEIRSIIDRELGRSSA